MCVKNTKVFYSGSSTIDQTLAQGALLDFDKVYSSYIDGNIKISVPGLYMVVADASGTAAAAGNIGIQLTENGSPFESYQSVAYSTGPTSPAHVGFSAIVRVDPTTCRYIDNSVTIGIASTEADTTFSNASLTIVRL